MIRMFTTIALIASFPWLGHWVWQHPDSRATLLLAVRILICVLIAAKIVVAMPIVHAIRRCHIASSFQLLTWTAVWFLAAVTLLGLIFCLVPAARHSELALVIAGVVLLLPYNRMIAMPLAWHHNRHR